MKDVKRCTKCKLPGHIKRFCDKDTYTVTKKDVDWAIKAFYKAKEQIEEEDFLYPKQKATD